MSRFNSKVKLVKKTRNLAGGEAYQLSPEMELFSTVCTSFLSDKYYRSGDKELERIMELVEKCDPVFVANLASYARNEMNLRSVPIVLTSVLSRKVGGSITKSLIPRIVKRVDEMTELVSFFSNVINTDNWKQIPKGSHEITRKVAKMPMSLKRGIADVFTSDKFDKYQYAKYMKNKNEFSLRDVLFLTHPKPKNVKQTELFKAIANKTLESADTWEVRQSKLGKENKDKNEEEISASKLSVWEDMVRSKKIGHMALLRNLRNILSLNPSTTFIDEVCEELVRGAKKGKQFPFRYWSAYKAVSGSTIQGWRGFVRKSINNDPFQEKKIITAINESLKSSIRSFPNLQGRTLIACDVSGSMFVPVSEKSEIHSVEIGIVLGSVVYSNFSDNSLFGIFGDVFSLMKLNSTDIIGSISTVLGMEGKVGYSTNGYKVIQDMNKRKIKLDNILIFTDCEMYGASIQEEWIKYKNEVSPKAKLYLFNLAGQGTSPIRIGERDTYMISGWSDKVFEAINYLSKEESDVKKMILEYTL